MPIRYPLKLVYKVPRYVLYVRVSTRCSLKKLKKNFELKKNLFECSKYPFLGGRHPEAYAEATFRREGGKDLLENLQIATAARLRWCH